MIDRDGIERPDETSEHIIPLHTKKNAFRITEKTYKRRNFFYRIFARFILVLASCVLIPFSKFFMRARVHGRKNLRSVKKSGAVIICNHCHHLDITLVVARVSPIKRVWVTALRSNFDIPFARTLLRALGGIPIPEDRKNMPYFMNGMDELLRRKQFLAFMPEVALWPYYRGLRPFKVSAFRFAAKNDKPVVPIAITFRLKTKRKSSGKIKRKYIMEYNVLPPVYPLQDNDTPTNSEYLMNKVHDDMNKLIETKNKENDEREYERNRKQ